jgi:hypothetical protein
VRLTFNVELAYHGRDKEETMPAYDAWAEKKAQEVKDRLARQAEKDRLFVEQQSLIKAQAPHLWLTLKGALFAKLEAFNKAMGTDHLGYHDHGNSVQMWSNAGRCGITFNPESFMVSTYDIRDGGEWEMKVIYGVV